MTFHSLQTNDTQVGRIGKHLVSKLFEPSIPPKGWQKRILRSAWDLAGRNQLAWLTIRILALFICLLFGLLEQSLSPYLPVLVRIVLFTSLNYGTGILCMVAAVAIAARADGERAEISAAKAPAAALVLGISKWTIYIILALILIEAGADFARDRRIELSIPDPVEIPAWAVSDYFLNYAAFLFSGILLALPRGGEFLYALLSLTGLSLDDAWQSGRKARRMLGVWIYVQILALLLAFPVGLEFLGQLLGFEWLRYLAIIWYPFGASLLYCYYREVYMGRTENSPETLKAARPSHVSSETAEVPLRRSFLSQCGAGNYPADLP